MNSASLLLLDTNVVLHLVRGKATGLALDKEFGLRARPDRPLISVVTVGELLALAARLKWGTKKVALLQELIRELVVVDIRNEPVLKKYAEIDGYLIGKGRKIGDNDIWIAATAAVTGAHLLTSDKDFDPLHDVFLTRLYYDPEPSADAATKAEAPVATTDAAATTEKAEAAQAKNEKAEQAKSAEGAQLAPEVTPEPPPEAASEAPSAAPTTTPPALQATVAPLPKPAAPASTTASSDPSSAPPAAATPSSDKQAE